jgi:hypothetical protein
MLGLSALLRKTAFKLIFIGVLKGEIEEKERRVKEERRAKDVVMEILLDVVVMEKNSLEEKTSLSTRVGTPRHGLLLQREVAPPADQLVTWRSVSDGTDGT